MIVPVNALEVTITTHQAVSNALISTKATAKWPFTGEKGHFTRDKGTITGEEVPLSRVAVEAPVLAAPFHTTHSGGTGGERRGRRRRRPASIVNPGAGSDSGQLGPEIDRGPQFGVSRWDATFGSPRTRRGQARRVAIAFDACRIFPRRWPTPSRASSKTAYGACLPRRSCEACSSTWSRTISSARDTVPLHDQSLGPPDASTRSVPCRNSSASALAQHPSSPRRIRRRESGRSGRVARATSRPRDWARRSSASSDPIQPRHSNGWRARTSTSPTTVGGGSNACTRRTPSCTWSTSTSGSGAPIAVAAKACSPHAASKVTSTQSLTLPLRAAWMCTGR